MYAIAGTADAFDYTGATPGTAKTITFAAGSAQFTAAKLIADVDFGASTDFSGTGPTNDNLI
jgi:hypothetical protein